MADATPKPFVDKVKSRKLLAFLFVVVANMINGYLGTPIDHETMGQVNELAIYYIGGQAAVDAVAPWMASLGRFGSQSGEAVAEAREKAKAEKEAEAEDGADGERT